MTCTPSDRDERSDVSRRRFVTTSAASAAALAVVPLHSVRAATESLPVQEEESAPAASITRETIAEAQKLGGHSFTDDEQDLIATTIASWPSNFERLRELDLPNGLGPATIFDPRRASGAPAATDSERGRIRYSDASASPLPTNDTDIAYASVGQLSAWIGAGELSSRRLTDIYLKRLERHGPALECVITLTADLARAQADRADRELAEGRSRGPLHGIPWGAKDLFDTKDLPTTWGAAPYRNRIATRDAAVVERLEQAGAVLVAKTTLGALAYGDIWFGGRTRNPWNLKQGSSGSSAGSAAGTAAGLFGFALGTETYGSIVSPCMRCGVTGLRPTFGRVPRDGAMALCWSLDKVGPITRSVEDALVVLDAIHGFSPGDSASVTAPLDGDLQLPVRGLRVGYAPSWFERRAHDLDRQALDHLRDAGVELVETALPEWPFDLLATIIEVESAAAHDELTRSNRDDELTWQAPEAWPNTFRSVRFLPAVELLQIERFRAQVCTMMAERFDGLDAMISPSFAANLLLITNVTGHPSLTLRSGFRAGNRPHGITLWGPHYREDLLTRLGTALEQRFGVWDRRPEL